ncbi:MAG: type II toxin-antitoxin system death-on-curing family toxin [Verrucomicrobiota bacterium]
MSQKPLWVPSDVIISTHEELVNRFGGSQGIRDEGMLESALNRPKHLFQYESADHYQLAASLAHGLVKNHPFIDGNIPLAFLAAVLFIERNGLRFQSDEVEVVERTLALAASAITEKDYADWLEKSCQNSK